MTSTSTTHKINKTKFWIEFLVTSVFLFFVAGWIGQIVPSIWAVFVIGFLLWPLVDLISPWQQPNFEFGPDYLGLRYQYFPILMAGLVALISVLLMLHAQGQSAKMYQSAAFAGLLAWASVEQLRIWFKLQKMSASNE
jgi:hypothetical protein